LAEVKKNRKEAMAAASKEKKSDSENLIEVIIKTKDLGELTNPPPLNVVNPIAEQFGNKRKAQEVLELELLRGDSTNSETQSTKSTTADLEKQVSKESTTTVKSEDADKETSYFVKKGEKINLNDVSTPAKEDDEETQKKKEEKIQKRLAERKELIEKYLKDGPLVYELYAILIHSGSAYGGHYYVYINSFEDGKWYNFNDSHVSEIDPEIIPSMAFGGGKSANAYMLIYRQLNSSDEKIPKIEDSEIPEDLRTKLAEDAKKEAA
jgi:hypothetical protein